ncbi:ATP-binding protein [Streptomyces sp. NBC_00879]|uniref:ATP-binding protein n=1 Tax=Streptomyces sp. NBC_00879 TaxID=2975855 RepID=UPI0038640FC1|nr:ATP-binding protein [Streptomyces sp. NBC_00879]
MRRADGPVPVGLASRELPLLGRQEERERLVRLLARGRSVRLTGPSGAGRTTLLDAVAADCAEIAPDGVIRVSGYSRTTDDLLHALFATVFEVPLYRPARAVLLAKVRDIEAVVVLDDLDFGGGALEELLAVTPACTYLLAATPDVPAPSADSRLEELFLCGLGHGSALELVERIVDRPLTRDEATWAWNVWFESEGLPLRLVQAGALLRQRDALPAESRDRDRPGVLGSQGRRHAPLPSLVEGATPVALLASRLSLAARETLRFAVALGGEVPQQVHLARLVGSAHAGAALGELVSCGLLTPVGSRYRLATAVAAQLGDEYAEGAANRAHTAALHYALWTRHPSVSPPRAAAEADAMLAAVAKLIAGDDGRHPTAAVLLARTAAPAFGASLHWGAWEGILRSGQEAARMVGDGAQEAYFCHELGLLALCHGQLDRARTELETSLGLRGALSDKRGTVAARRVLALVADRLSGGVVSNGPYPVSAELPVGHNDELDSHPRGIRPSIPLARQPDTVTEAPPVVTRQPSPSSPASVGVAFDRRRPMKCARRNVIAVGAGGLLALAMSAVVVLGVATEGNAPPDKGKADLPKNEDRSGSHGLNTDEPAHSSTLWPPGGGGQGGASSTPRGGAHPSGSGMVTGGPPSDGSHSTARGTNGSPPTGSPPASRSPTATTVSPSSGGTDTGGAAVGGTSGGTETGGVVVGGTETGGAAVGGTSGGTDTGGAAVGGTSGGTDTGGAAVGGTTGEMDVGGTDAGGTGGWWHGRGRQRPRTHF